MGLPHASFCSGQSDNEKTKARDYSVRHIDVSKSENVSGTSFLSLSVLP
jgi:hypothetical protein